MTGPLTFRLLNEDSLVKNPQDWNDSERSRLWRYHLHYHDDLASTPNAETGRWHRELVEVWLRDNLPGSRPGWEPYPLSRRLVNWIKWLWLENTPAQDMLPAVVVQANWLLRRLEFHLLGNHLLSDLKALLFFSAGFRNPADDSLRRRLAAWLGREIRRQFPAELAGAHYELSPMYHRIVLEDILDLVNLWNAAGWSGGEVLKSAAVDALEWAELMSDAKGNPDLLSDSVADGAASIRELSDYAGRLGLERRRHGRSLPVCMPSGWTLIQAGGYWLFRFNGWRLVFDVGPLGPDHLPGHAHGDMLSLLLEGPSGHVVADTGVLSYAADRDRILTRSTASHNTVTVDGRDQAEFWAAFRVARRGTSVGLCAAGDEVSCSHDGYMRQGIPVIHRRALLLQPDGFEVIDTLEGTGSHKCATYWHLAPGIEPEVQGRRVTGQDWVIESSQARWQLTESPFAPSFGVRQKRLSMRQDGQFSGVCRATWRFRLKL